MSDRMIPVPESSLRALALPAGHPDREKHYTAIATLVACLPEPEPTFTDEEALAFYRALNPTHSPLRSYATDIGRKSLNLLAKAGWTAPKSLCPPPSPALVELVEAAISEAIDHDHCNCPLCAAVATYDSDRCEHGWTSNCPMTCCERAAVAAYDEQEGT